MDRCRSIFIIAGLALFFSTILFVISYCQHPRVSFMDSSEMLRHRGGRQFESYVCTLVNLPTHYCANLSGPSCTGLGECYYCRTVTTQRRLCAGSVGNCTAYPPGGSPLVNCGKRIYSECFFDEILGIWRCDTSGGAESTEECNTSGLKHLCSF